MKVSKSTVFKVLFLLTLIVLPFLMTVITQEHSAAAYAIASANGYGSATGAIVFGTAVNVGWAIGALCGVQLVVGLIAAG